MSGKQMGALDRLLGDNTVKLVIWFLAIVSPVIGGLMVDAMRDVYVTINTMNLKVVPQVEKLGQDVNQLKGDMAANSLKLEGVGHDVEWLKDTRRGQ